MLLFLSGRWYAQLDSRRFEHASELQQRTRVREEVRRVPDGETLRQVPAGCHPFHLLKIQPTFFPGSSRRDLFNLFPQQMKSGVHDVLPKGALDTLTPEDIRLLLNGVGDIDVETLISYTSFNDESGQSELT